MKFNNIYCLLLLLSVLVFNSCGGDGIEGIGTNENDLERYYEENGRIDMTVNGQEIETPLVGGITGHPSITGGIYGNTLIVFTWSMDAWLQSALVEGFSDNRKLELLTFVIGLEYAGVGKYSLKNSDHQICYAFSFYDKTNNDVVEGDFYCSNILGNNNDDGFIEITADENGSIKGKFLSNVKSEDSGDTVLIEGTFDINYEE